MINTFLISSCDLIPKDKLFNISEYDKYNKRYEKVLNSVKKNKNYFEIGGFKSIINQVEVTTYYNKYWLY